MKTKKKMVIYQVLPRLFGNDNGKCVKNGTIGENGSGKFSAFTPAALKAIGELGSTHIWYTGIIEHATQTDYSTYGIATDHPDVVKGIAGSPYAVKDYYDVDPDLADDVTNRMAEFEALVERTHSEGMEVIIDFVPNHVARQYRSDAKPEGVCDLGEGDELSVGFSNQNNFYYIAQSPFAPQFELSSHKSVEEYSEFPAKATGNDVFSASPSRDDWYETVKLNYGVDYLSGGTGVFAPTPDTWKKMLDILLFWAAKRVDGFRCDMAQMVPVAFWNWVIPKVKERFPDVIFIAEIYESNRYREFLSEGHFDYLYDKVGLYDTLRGVVCGHTWATEITRCWQANEGIQARMLNFMENHDEQRVASDFFAADARKGFPAMVVAAAMNTNPVMIYAGQELGERGMDEEGFSGRDGRTTIFDYWTVASIRDWRNNGVFDGAKLTDEQRALRDAYIKLLNLCRTELAINEGKFFDLMFANYYNDSFNCDRLYVFFRHLGSDILLVCVNFGSEAAATGVNIPAYAFEYIGIEAGNSHVMTDLLTGEQITADLNPDQRVFFDMPPHSARIFKL